MNEQTIIFGGFSEQPEPRRYDPEVSNWVKSDNIVKPSTNITVLSKLEPGIYTADYDQEIGYYCRKLNSPSDELFVFSDSIVKDLLEEIDIFWKKKDLYKEKKIIHKRGILLEGYSGTGKSSIIIQSSNEVIKQGGIVFKITDSRNLTDYMEFMRTGFRKIEPDTPVITIIEDINKYESVEVELLDFLDGQFSLNHHIVIATTNDTSEIPNTLLRPSRFDLRIEIPLPSEQTRREYFQFKKINEDSLEELVKQSEGCSLADLKEIYVSMFLLDYSINEAIKKVTTIRDKKNFLNSTKKVSKIAI